MKRPYLYAAIIGGIIILSSGVSKELKSSGPPSCVAGEPPNNANCTTSGCHDDGTANTGSADILLDLGTANNGYDANTEYIITVRVKKPGLPRAGFQLIALQDNDTRFTPGTITLTDPNRMQIIDKNNQHPGPIGCFVDDRVWVEHTYNGTAPSHTDSTQWQFKWTSPAASVGDVTFYVAVNEANGDNSEAGDEIYTRSKKIAFTGTGIQATAIAPAAVYPNPCGEETYIDPDYNFRILSITDLSGKEWIRLNRENLAVKEGKLVIPTLVAPKGILLLNFEGPNGVATLKVLKYK